MAKRRAVASTTQLTAPSEVWHARFGAGSFPFGRAGRALKPLLDAGHTPELIAEHLAEYLDCTPPRFASLERFVATFAEWKPNAEPLVDDDGVIRE